MIRSLINVSPHVRSRPYAAEYERVHLEMVEARIRDQSIAEGMKRLVQELDRELERDWEGR